MLLPVNINKPPASVFMLCILSFLCLNVTAQSSTPKFSVIAFYTEQNDKAHISFVREANKWFPKMADKYKFKYDSTKNWENLNAEFLSHYQVILFLDTRPNDPMQRTAFRQYMENGGAWMGFHFSAFAFTPSDVPQNWDWYHNVFLGSGSYVSNTWRPTSAILDVDTNFAATKHLPQKFKSSPNEWYRWQFDLRINKNIRILASINPASFPLGTGPKLNEIWHSGFYPVIWTNINYRMIYMNIGHNDIDYEHKTDKDLSLTFNNKTECKLILDALLWLGHEKKQ